MVKTKQTRTRTVHGKKNGAPVSLVDLSDSNTQDEDDWVIVKKQRVTILVPAAPVSEPSLPVNLEPSHTQLMLPKTTSNNHSQLPTETTTLPTFPASVNEQEKTLSVVAQQEIQVARNAPPSLPCSTLAKPPRVDQRTGLENPHRRSIMKSNKVLSVSKTSKAFKQPRMLLASNMPSNLGVSLNQGLLASNLERKLTRAGGLSRWLKSLGLGQFVRIFQGKNLSKYQLANLTMKKLKDMGANAVGPRRKLIHAIGCVCQPYCFEAL